MDFGTNPNVYNTGDNGDLAMNMVPFYGSVSTAAGMASRSNTTFLHLSGATNHEADNLAA